MCQDGPGSSCIFPTLALEPIISPRSPGLFLLEIVFQDHTVDSQDSNFCWVTFVFLFYAFFFFPIDRIRKYTNISLNIKCTFLLNEKFKESI